MDPIAKALSEGGDTLTEVAELLYGDGAWEFISKKSAQQEKNERMQARIGLASNAIGLAAGAAGTKAAWDAYKGVGKPPANPGSGLVVRAKGVRGTLKNLQGVASRNPKKMAGAALALQVTNVAGDAVANRVLARSAKKQVAKGWQAPAPVEHVAAGLAGAAPFAAIAYGSQKHQAKKRGQKAAATRARNAAVSKGVFREAKNAVKNADRAAASMANSAEKIERALPSKKKLGLYTAGTLTALAGSQYAATYYGTKHGNEKQIGGVVGRAPKKAVSYGLQKVENGKVKKSFDWDSTFEISKVDTDKRQVFGWASVITMDGKPVVDLQDDYMAMETIEKAAYDYVKSSRKGGDMHRRNGAEPHHVSDMIESFVVTEEKKEKLGLPPEFPTGWLVGFQVNDDETWNLVKDGKRKQFSIHGSGQRVEKVLD